MSTEPATSAADVLAANAAFYAAFNARDLAAMDALWARSAPVACVHPGRNALTGRDEVLASWRAILAHPETPRIFTGGESARLLGEVAYVICRELVGGSPLAATNVFVREDGRWRLAHHHASAVAI